jgi:hypothetical protein
MNPYFLFPADPLNHRVIDCDFQDQVGWTPEEFAKIWA